MLYIPTGSIHEVCNAAWEVLFTAYAVCRRNPLFPWNMIDMIRVLISQILMIISCKFVWK